jgi:hypothetical protein
MDYYRFVVTSFEIAHTRSIHDDTLQLAHSVHVDDDVVASNVVKLGDFNNGTYQTEDYVHGTDPLGITNLVINDPDSKVTFTFQLLNSGNEGADVLSGRVIATADQLAGIGSGLAGAGADSVAAAAPASLAIGLGLELFANIYAWLSTDCDGPVAVDQLSGPRFVIDTWADDDTTGTGTISRDVHYPGIDSPDGCGANSDYTVSWLAQHWRGWAEVVDSAENGLRSAAGVSGAAHRGAVHAFGVLPGGVVTHARTFNGRSWLVATAGTFQLSDLPVSAASFDGRLYLIGVTAGQNVAVLAYTADGGSWVDTASASPPAITTAQPVAAATFANRLYLFARDSGTGSLEMTSTSDLQRWNGWAPVPVSGLAPRSPVAASEQAGRLYLFGITDTEKPIGTSEVVVNSTADGVTWSGWQMLEEGARPEGAAQTDQPLDVTASPFEGRLHLASRWQPAGQGTAAYTAVNFSADGVNWSGWRQPEATVADNPGATPALAGVGHHLYVFTAGPAAGGPAQISVH